MGHICLIDEHEPRFAAWQRSLGAEVKVWYFRDPGSFLVAAESAAEPLPRFYCLIAARNFARESIDLLYSPLAARLKEQADCPLFLSWPGPTAILGKQHLIDGIISQPFGINLAALHIKIKRLAKKQLSLEGIAATSSRERRCQQLFRHMAQQAQGSHRRILEKYAAEPGEQGIELLENLYQRLLAQKETPAQCPSRYIHTSPLLALRLLKETLNLRVRNVPQEQTQIVVPVPCRVRAPGASAHQEK
jgi:hypothetical protein